jgi:hypothetical protein
MYNRMSDCDMHIESCTMRRLNRDLATCIPLVLSELILVFIFPGTVPVADISLRFTQSFVKFRTSQMVRLAGGVAEEQRMA